MSEIKVNKISPRTACGTTTLGDSGDTFTIPAGVTLTNSGTAAGFGSTGEVSWNTTKITADPGPAVSGVGYFTDTSGAAFNLTLPSSPSAGAVVAVADYANSWDANALTILRNGSNIEGSAANLECNIEGAAITLVYVDATKGWVTTNTGNSTDAQSIKFIAASGGSESTSGNFKIHTFTGPGTFTISCAGSALGSNTLDYLVIGGGAGASGDRGGGGGAGGYRFSNGTASGCYAAGPSPLGASGLSLPATAYPIAVGGGGAGTGPGSDANPGVASSFSTITSAGGGHGARQASAAGTGGSGGAGAGIGPNSNSAGAAGNTPPVSPPQGNTGGDGNGTESGPVRRGGGGGGGAGAAGTTATTSVAGQGGNGLTSCITASPVARGGGGGGGGTGGGYSVGGGGGTGGGGSAGTPGGSGSANTGGGAGAGCGQSTNCGGSGGSGVVIIRYKFQ
jgi:hypothetical protein